MTDPNKININSFRNSLKVNEGYQSKPYQCPDGRLTIGYGRNLQDRGITRKEADYLLDNDIEQALLELDKTFVWWRTMAPARQEALADMCFNLGIRRLSKFKNMILALAERRWADAARECLWNNKDLGVATPYADQVGRRAVRNAHAFEFGEWPK